MSGLASFGAIAGGFAQGMQRGQDFKNDRDAAARRKTLQDREDTDYARKLSMQNDMDAARAAAGNVMQQYQQDWQKSQGPVNNYLTLGGAEGSVPDQSATDAAPKSQPYKPSLAQQLKAQQAFTDTLFSRGRMDEGMQHWVQGEAQRAKVRQMLTPQTIAALQGGGDVTKPLSAYYDTLDDGQDLVSAKQNPGGLDGKLTYNVKRRNLVTGELTELNIPAESIAEQIERTSQDPILAAKFSWQKKMEDYKRGLGKEEEDQKQKGREGLADINNKAADARNERNNEAAKEVARIRSGATLGAAGLRASGGGSAGGGGAKIQRTMVDSEGFMVGVFKDGSTKRLDINGQPVRAGEWSKRVDRVASDLGKGIGGIGKSPQELRQQAEQTLIGGSTAAPAVAQPKSNKDFSSLWK